MEFKYYTNPKTGDCTWTGAEVPAGTIIYYNGQYWIATDVNSWQGDPDMSDEYNTWMPAGEDLTDFKKYAALFALRTQVPKRTNAGVVNTIYVDGVTNKTALRGYYLQTPTNKGTIPVLSLSLEVAPQTKFTANTEYRYSFENVPLSSEEGTIDGVNIVDKTSLATVPDSYINLLAYVKFSFYHSTCNVTFVPFTNMELKAMGRALSLITLNGGIWTNN